MPYYEYQGERYFLLKNSIQCRRCLEVIESRMLTDHVKCRCMTCSISGGLETPGHFYGDRSHIKDVSIWATKGGKWLPAEIVETMFIKN